MEDIHLTPKDRELLAVAGLYIGGALDEARKQFPDAGQLAIYQAASTIAAMAAQHRHAVQVTDAINSLAADIDAHSSDTRSTLSDLHDALKSGLRSIDSAISA